MIQTGTTKKIKIGKLIDDSVYLLNDAKYISQKKLLENSIDDYNKMYNCFEKFILLTNELLKKEKIIEIMKKRIDKNNE